MTEALTLAVQNAPVLRELALGGPSPRNVADIAVAIRRDVSNLSKTVTKLAEAGLVDARHKGKVRYAELTPAGRALLPGLDALEGVGDPATLTHAQLRPSPLNPRKDWTSEAARQALDGLRASILTAGLLQPLVVQRAPDANGVRAIVAGESRWRAIGAAIADGDLPDDWPIAVVLRDLEPAEHARLALIENLVRRDLHPLEEAEAFAALERADTPRAEVAEIAGRTPEFVGQRVRLLNLPKDDQARMQLDADNPRHLSLTGARNLLQGRAEEPPARAAPEVARRAEGHDAGEPALFPISGEERALTAQRVAAAVASGKFVEGTAQPESEEFIDRRALRHFTRALEEKLAAARAKGRGGWQAADVTCRALAHQLLDHTIKGDPLDVAAFAMFVWCKQDSDGDYHYPLRKAARGRVLPESPEAALSQHRPEGSEKIALKGLLGAVQAVLASADDRNVGYFAIAPVADEVFPRLRAAVAAAEGVLAGPREDA